MSKFVWKHFFFFLLLFVALAQWLCLWWLAHDVAAVGAGALVHLLGPCGFFLLNRFVLARPLPHRAFGRVIQRWYTAIAFTAIFGAIFLFAASLLRALVMLAAGYALGASEASMTGLAELADRVTTGGLTVTALLMVYGYTLGQRRFVIRRFGLRIGGLETGPHGLRLVHLSDIHLGRFMSAEQITGYVERANALEPDLMVITGDITDGLEHAHETFPALGRLEARLGVYAILGNHDLATGGEAVANALGAYTTIKLLRDECVCVDLDVGRLHLIGLLDRGLDWARGVAEDPALEALCAAVPPGEACVLLSHRPDLFQQAARLGVDLVLSGHTHGGQLALPLPGGRRASLAYFMTRYPRGTFYNGKSVMHVNTGLGVTGQPVRIATPREVSCITLGGDTLTETSGPITP